jgi:quercetin dioxygenase-like cupin family protein
MDPLAPWGPHPTAAQIRAIRRRLMERVADADTSHLTLPPGEAGWQDWLPGVRIKVLREEAGVMSYLLRLAPGASVPAHRHRLDEECLVLQGRLRVGSQLQLDAGGYHLAHQGALHASLSSDEGALIFLRGASPDARDALA